MTEDRGHFDPHTRHPNRPPDGLEPKPQPLRDLLRQYIEDRGWTSLLPAPASNGHRGDNMTREGRDHG